MSSPTRTIQQFEPPFWKKPYTEWAMYVPSMKGPLSGSFRSPKIFANWVQLRDPHRRRTPGTTGVRPTNAATELLTPSIGLFAEGTSST